MLTMEEEAVVNAGGVMLVSKNAKMLPRTQNPYTSQWNIGCVGSHNFLLWPCTFHVVCAHFISVV